MYAEELLPQDYLSTGRVAHSLVWISSDCHGVVAVLVISGKQPSSALLHTLRLFLCLCLAIKRRVLQYRVIFFTPWKHSRLPGYPLARVTTLTNVDDTACLSLCQGIPQYPEYPGWLYVLGMPLPADVPLSRASARATDLGRGPNLRIGSGRAPCVPRSREHEERPAARRENMPMCEKKTHLYTSLYKRLPFGLCAT